MNGFPKWINTRQDLDHLRNLFPVETRDYMKDLYENRHDWIMLHRLSDDDEGVNSDEFKVIENVSNREGASVDRYQYQHMEDPNGPIFRLGFASSNEFLNYMQAIEQ